MPQQIAINTDNNSNAINYLYDAMGTKLHKQTKISDIAETTTDYIGNFVYEDNVLRYILTSEGRAMANEDGTFDYQYFLKDHLGNTRVTFDQNGTVIQENSYYPFGMAMTGLAYQSGTDYKNKYLYNGKELQDEFGLGWYDYGARFYDAQLGRFHTVDPLADERRWVSPYNYVQNNPTNRVDPTGALDWKPDSEGNLIAQSGDNAQTLADYQGISYSEGLKQLTDQGYKVNTKGILNLKIGNKVEMNNVYTESIDKSTGGYSTDVMMGLAPKPAGSGPGVDRGTPEDNYNCWGSACAGSQGKKIEVGVGIGSGTTFDANLTSDYTPTTTTSAKFGKTVLRFANSVGVQHGAVFYGKSKNGTIYVYTKNGWHAKPEVMKLSDLQLKIPSYGTVQGINTGDSGYYDPNSP